MGAGHYAIDDAEDALQATFLRAYRSLGKYQERDKFSAWLYRILVNQCRSLAARRNQRDRIFVREEALLLNAPDRRPTWTGEDEEFVQRVLAELDPLLREAFLLKYVEEMSYEEMSTLTGVGVSALKMRVKRENISMVPASSPAGVLSALEHEDFDAALIDLNYARDTTSGGEGLDLLSRLRALDPTLPVVVMTAWGSVEGAVEAMRRGARDYVQKPWDNARLVATLRTQVELGRALRRSLRLEEENSRLRGSTPQMIARSPAMQAVLRVLEKVAPSDANVLITGEHGTGKEVVARYIHAASKRAGKPLVTVNAGGVAEGVFESELFGHVRGAFTDAKTDRAGAFEVADSGTLFLDEVGNMPTQQQAKLLRVLQTGEFTPVGSSKVKRSDVRVLAATNARLHEEVAQGRFREDLLYRLNTVEVQLPPLRDRLDDIPQLAQFFLKRIVDRGRAGRAGAPTLARQRAGAGARGGARGPARLRRGDRRAGHPPRRAGTGTRAAREHDP